MHQFLLRWVAASPTLAASHGKAASATSNAVAQIFIRGGDDIGRDSSLPTEFPDEGIGFHHRRFHVTDQRGDVGLNREKLITQ